MRLFNDYKIIFCDIDDTLVHGFMTDLMKVTWDKLHSNTVADLLMEIQERFNLFKVNERLRFILKRYNGKIVFLTARRYHEATLRLLDKILGKEYDLSSLATDTPEKDKVEEIQRYMQIFTIKGDKCAIFDDNKKVRFAAGAIGIDTFDPTVMIERLV